MVLINDAPSEKVLTGTEIATIYKEAAKKYQKYLDDRQCTDGYTLSPEEAIHIIILIEELRLRTKLCHNILEVLSEGEHTVDNKISKQISKWNEHMDKVGDDRFTEKEKPSFCYVEKCPNTAKRWRRIHIMQGGFATLTVIGDCGTHDAGLFNKG